jgi:serine/threonine protein kinase
LTPTQRQYELIRVLSTRENQTVYLANLLGYGGFRRTVALRSIQGDEEERNREISNAKLCAMLSHTNIVQILDVGQHVHGWFVAMEYVDGPSLKQLIDAAKAEGVEIEPSLVIYIVSETLKALEYSHSRILPGGTDQGIAHHNLNTRNVLVNFQGGLKVNGFSLAPSDGKHRPPEALPDTRGDLYSCGVLLEEFLAVSPALSTEGFQVLIKQSMEADPSQRFQSARAMREALLRNTDGIEITAPNTLSQLLFLLFPPSEDFGEDQPTFISQTSPISKSKEFLTTLETKLERTHIKVEPFEETEAPPQEPVREPTAPPIITPQTGKKVVFPLALIALSVGVSLVTLFVGFFLGVRARPSNPIIMTLKQPSEQSIHVNGKAIGPQEQQVILPARKNHVIELGTDAAMRIGVSAEGPIQLIPTESEERKP